MRALIITKKIEVYSVKRLSEELTQLGIPYEIFLWQSLRFTDSDIVHRDTNTSLSDFDFIIPRRAHGSLLTLLAQFCKEKNISLLNREFFDRHSSFNKLEQQFYLKKLGLLGIPSAYSPSGNFQETVNLYGLPFVAKLAEGSLGKEVSKITNEGEFQEFLSKRRADRQLFLFQKLFPITSDYRVFFLHGKTIGIIERFNNTSEWRTNVATSEPRIQVENPELMRLGIHIGGIFNFDLVGIDILQDREGNYRVIELNTLAHFKILEKISSINVAKKIVEMMVQKTKEMAQLKA